MNKNYIIIYGGSSLISKELLKILAKEYNNFSKYKILSTLRSYIIIV